LQYYRTDFTVFNCLCLGDLIYNTEQFFIKKEKTTVYIKPSI